MSRPLDDVFYQRPHVTDAGEVMIHEDMFDKFNYYPDLIKIGEFYRLDGLPSILKAFRGGESIIALTQSYFIVIIDRSGVEQLDLPPIRELNQVMGRLFIIDNRNNLRELIRYKTSYKISRLVIPNVKLINMMYYCESIDIISIIDTDNTVYIFLGDNLTEPSFTINLQFNVRIAYLDYIISSDNQVFRLIHNEDNNEYIIASVGELPTELKYSAYSYRESMLHVIDYDGVLTNVKLMCYITYDKLEGCRYTGFYSYHDHYILIQNSDGKWMNIRNNIILNLPFSFINVQEFQLQRQLPMVKSARNKVQL